MFTLTGVVPRPQLIGASGQQLWLLVERMPSLVAPFSHFIVGSQEPIHRSQRAQVNPFIEQAGMDLSGRLVNIALTMQEVQHLLLLPLA